MRLTPLYLEGGGSFFPFGKYSGLIYEVDRANLGGSLDELIEG